MIGDWVRTQRQARGWNQSQLARLMGVKPNTINQWESGDRKNISSAHLAVLANVFGKTLEEIYIAAGLAPTPIPPDILAELLAEGARLQMPADVLQLYRQEYPNMPRLRQEQMLRDLTEMVEVYRARWEARQETPAERPAQETGASGGEVMAYYSAPPMQASRPEGTMLLRRESAGGC